MKQCKVCNINKKNSEFYAEPKNKDKRKNECKVCYNFRTNKYGVKFKYNITAEQKQAMVESQNNCCAICREPFSSSRHTHVDHCHDTNGVRKILCNHCNRGLGGFRDNIDYLKNAIKYLEPYAKQESTTPVSNGDYIQGAVGAELGSISTPWTWEDGNNSDHHSGAVQGQDVDHRAEESGGDSVGHGGEEMGTLEALKALQNFGIALSAAISPEPTRGHFLSELRERGLVNGTTPDEPIQEPSNR